MCQPKLCENLENFYLDFIFYKNIKIPYFICDFILLNGAGPALRIAV